MRALLKNDKEFVWSSLHDQELISKCDVCLSHHYKLAKEPIADVPTQPWQKVGTDLFQLNGKDFLVVIEYYSNYPEIEQLRYTTTNDVIHHMKCIFAKDMEFPSLCKMIMVLSIVVRNSDCLQNSTALSIQRLTPFIQKQMEKQKKGCKL